MRKRSYNFHLYLNEEEFRKLDSLSHKSGLSFSSLLHGMITGTEIRERWNPDYRSLIRAIDKAGNN